LILRTVDPAGDGQTVVVVADEISVFVRPGVTVVPLRSTQET